jgi:hypothetical protein
LHPALKKVSLPRALLLGLIRVYRQRLAGRGPFRNVRCTFAHLESCSAYGERIAREAPSTGAALRCICGRLRRCRDLSLFRFPDGALGWASRYDPLVSAVSPPDAVGALDDDLRQAGECSEVRVAVRDASLLVLDHARDGYGRKSTALLVRNALAVRRSLRRRFHNRAAMSLFLVGLAAVGASAQAGIALFLPLMPAATIVTVSAWASHRLVERIDRLEVLSALEPPVAQPMPTAPEGAIR